MPLRRRPARIRSRRCVLAAVVSGLLLAGACGSQRSSADPPGDEVDATVADAREETDAPPGTTPPPPTTALAGSDGATCPPPAGEPGEGDAVPADLTTELTRRLADPRFAPHRVSASIWIEGYGEVAGTGTDTALLPASNQKLLTAVGALELLPHDGRFETDVLADGPVADGILDGRLVVRAGGDPTLTGATLADLAAQVRAAGIVQVGQGLFVDESRFDDRRDAEGWQDWQRPTYVGSLSAFVVDGNDQRADDAYLADPAVANAARFADALRAAGVHVDRTAHGGASESATVVATARSAPFAELVQAMLTRSDNMIAESLVKEIGLRHRDEGSTADGLEAVHAAMAQGCIRLDGRDGDGSGLSRANARTATEWVALLQWARARPWWPVLEAGLPLAGRTGTLRGRLGTPPTVGNVRAKTGSIIPGRALSGIATTAGGRQVVFSVVVNGEWPEPAEQAIDDLIVAAVANG